MKFESKDRLRRAVELRAATSTKAGGPIVGDDRLLTLSFSSEAPVERYFGDEVLSHARGAADLSRLNDGAPLLWNHDPDQVVGVVEQAWIDKQRGMATVRFARTPEGDRLLGMVNDGVVRNVSFAYQVDDYTADPDLDEDAYLATRWKAYEISLVSIPADQSVGVGRSLTHKGLNIMDNEGTEGSPSRRERARMEGITEGRMEGERAGAQAERLRSAEISAWGKKLNLGDLADDMVRAGTSVEDALARFRERADFNPRPSVRDFGGGFGGGELGMGREAGDFSIVRAINAIVKSDWSKAGLERAASQEVAKRTGRDSPGFFVPSDVQTRWQPRLQQQRAVYQVGTAGQGGNLVATNLLAGSFIDVLRNSTVTGKLGATYLTGLIGKIAIPRRSASSVAGWVAESGALGETEATFDQVTLSPKTVGGFSKMSRLTLLQTTPDIEMLTRADLAKVMGLAIDLAAISGSGAGNQPTGIVNQAGVGAVIGGTNGANVSFDNIIALYTALRTANAPQDNLGFAINAKTYGYLSTQKATTGQYLWNPGGGVYGAPADTLRGYPYAVSNQLRSTLTKGTSSGICSELVYGNWDDLLIGEWGVLEILVNPYDSTGFTTGDVLIRAMQTLDVAVRHGPSFAVMSDALTPGF